MNFRTTLILLVVLAGALVFVFVANRAPEPEKKPAEAAADANRGRKLFDQSSDDVTRLTMKSTDGSSIELAKEGAKWKLKKPVEWPADDYEARSLVDSVLGLRSRGSVDLNGAELSTTGLDKPRFTIEATDIKGKTIKLDVGNRSALGSDLYVKLADQSAGELVGGGTLADKLEKGTDKLAASLRDKQLVRINSFDVRQLRITRKGQTLSLQKDGNDWKITDPKQAPADSTEVSDLLSTVTGIRADSYVDAGSPQASAAGIDHPKVTVWLSAAVPTTQPATTEPAGVTVKICEFTDIDKEKAFVQVSDVSALAQVPLTETSLGKLIGASAVTLRDKKVVDVDPEKVSGFTLAVDKPATTQPATHPADLHELTIARRQEAKIMGPMLPGAPSTQPASAPATQASDTPATAPATQAATTQPASAWVFNSGGTGDAEEGQVKALLDGFHPLKAEKYLDKAPATQPSATYRLTIHTTAATGTTDYIFQLIDQGGDKPLIGSYQDLAFEVERSLAAKLGGDFKTKKP